LVKQANIQFTTKRIWHLT